MSRLTKSVLLALCVYALQALTPALAQRIAELADPVGRVLVNQGERFRAAEPGMPLRRGDRILTLDDAEVKVIYRKTRSDGGRRDVADCEVRLPQNSDLVITDLLECPPRVLSVNDSGIETSKASSPGAGGEQIVPWFEAEPSVNCTLFDCLPAADDGVARP